MSARRSSLAAAPLLAAPVVLSFFSGGYFDVPRLVAVLVACAALLVVAVVAPRPLPATAAGRCVAAALALLALWTALSIARAPLPGRALDDAERAALYLVVFLVAAAVLRGAAVRAVEPGLLAGIALVCVYGLSERLLPGLIDLASSRSAAGRLEQPLTYWNAIGLLAALGLVLAVRGAGDPTRPEWSRTLAAAAAPVTGAALVLTFSRGAIVAAFAGLVVIAMLTSTRQGAVAARYCVGAALLAAVTVALLPAVRTLEGDGRDAQGAVALLALLVLTLLVAYAVRRGARAAASERPDRVHRVRRATVAGIVLAFVALILVAAAAEKGVGTPETGATASRLASAQSNRYAYWGVAVDTFAEHPLRGIGAGGFRQTWLEKREIRETVNDAHSLYLETAAELGLVGLALLAALIGGIVACGRRMLREDREAAVGPVAALAAFGLHAGLDWDWEMPALTIIALLLAAVLVTGAEGPAPRAGWAPRAAVALCAVVVAVPLAVDLRGVLLVREAREVIGSDPAALSETEAARALDLLRRAARLTPDSEPEVLEVTLLFLQHRERESARVAERLVRAEPDNVVAWRLAAGLRKRLDPARAPAADARVRALDPRSSP